MSTSKENFWKFNEGEVLKQVEEYIISTYGAHYASEDNSIQAIDLINSIGHGASFSQDNVIKYGARYERKGQSKSDALKIIHYGILLYHFSGHDKPLPQNYNLAWSLQLYYEAITWNSCNSEKLCKHQWIYSFPTGE